MPLNTNDLDMDAVFDKCDTPGVQSPDEIIDGLLTNAVVPQDRWGKPYPAGSTRSKHDQSLSLGGPPSLRGVTDQRRSAGGSSSEIYLRVSAGCTGGAGIAGQFYSGSVCMCVSMHACMRAYIHTRAYFQIILAAQSLQMLTCNYHAVVINKINHYHCCNYCVDLDVSRRPV